MVTEGVESVRGTGANHDSSVWETFDVLFVMALDIGGEAASDPVAIR